MRRVGSGGCGEEWDNSVSFFCIACLCYAYSLVGSKYSPGHLQNTRGIPPRLYTQMCLKSIQNIINIGPKSTQTLSFGLPWSSLGTQTCKGAQILSKSEPTGEGRAQIGGWGGGEGGLHIGGTWCGGHHSRKDRVIAWYGSTHSRKDHVIACYENNNSRMDRVTAWYV